jgi:hypothetical protein
MWTGEDGHPAQLPPSLVVADAVHFTEEGTFIQAAYDASGMLAGPVAKGAEIT